MKKDSVFKMVIVLTLTCLTAGVCLSFTYMYTKDAIASAEKDATLSSVRKVLPEFDGDPEEKMLTVNDEEKVFYVGKKNGEIVGVATSSSSMGYGGAVSILVGVDVYGAITGIVLLQHQETPGLGTKAANPEFLDQFQGKRLDDAGDAIALVNYGGDIQGITSATITSRAVTQAATNALRMFLKHRIDIMPGQKVSVPKIHDEIILSEQPIIEDVVEETVELVEEKRIEQAPQVQEIFEEENYDSGAEEIVGETINEIETQNDAMQ